MMTKQYEGERNLVRFLIRWLETNDATLTKEEIEQKTEELARLFGYDVDIRNVVNEAMIAIDTRMGAGVSLVDNAAHHDEHWVQNRDITWTYSDAYEEHLLDSGWSEQLVHSLGNVTTKILGHLQDPLSEGNSWNRRGLVIGHVQSGKTANYTGLLARAADAGYKFIIVIAGIHNNLRKQTQQRIEEAFVGRSTNPGDKRDIGVGCLTDYPHPTTLTTVNEDFNKHTADKIGLKINDSSRPIVVVIKKNVTTLEALRNWLRDMNTKGRTDRRIADVPMLMIDDEADNASINTNKDETNPTKTNALIRSILKLFEKSSYVGYTATPFANIFINPDAYDPDCWEELFPRDFIYCLDAPTSYFGPEKVFINQESSAAITRTITDCETVLPFSHKKDISVAHLPASLYKAVNVFIIARAIRNLRGEINHHCSMMVNVSRFVFVQSAVRDLLSLHIKKTANAVAANYMKPEEQSARNAFMQDLRDAFESEYRNTDVTWEQVKSELNNVTQQIRLCVINSGSDEALDFKGYERDGTGLTVIAVGGLSLSRGLTIEGLTVSYMYRNTKMYDTLMQMGRWFGYRPGYEDLCRVYLSADSIGWYSHIAEAADELVTQIKQMRQDKLSPKDFGLYVRRHPDSLLITSANKMRAGKEETFEQSYSGKLVESYILSIDPEVNRHNFNLLQKFWNNGFGGVAEEISKKGWIFRDVKTTIVEEYLREFQCHSDFQFTMSGVIGYLSKIAPNMPLADVLLISPSTAQRPSQQYTLANQIRSVDTDQPNGTAWRLLNYRLGSATDESIGLSPDQEKAAEAEAVKDNTTGYVAGKHYRKVRNKPLLMLHSIEPKGGSFSGPIAAFGVSFPYGDYATTVKVVVNKVWLKQTHGVTDELLESAEDAE
jgi:hypothetical protein